MWRPVKAPPNSGITGWIYLLHFDRPFGHARHYTGWTGDLPGRLRDHKNGQGSNLCRKAAAAGVGWTLVSVVPGDKNEERRLKNLGGAAKRCPVCQGHVPSIDREAAALLISAGTVTLRVGANETGNGQCVSSCTTILAPANSAWSTPASTPDSMSAPSTG